LGPAAVPSSSSTRISTSSKKSIAFLDGLDVLVSLDRVAVVAPTALRQRIARCGVSGSHVLAARLGGLDVELGFFLGMRRPRPGRYWHESRPPFRRRLMGLQLSPK
jgi:hypothetical protein